jgi:hypothetical protein
MTSAIAWARRSGSCLPGSTNSSAIDVSARCSGGMLCIFVSSHRPRPGIATTASRIGSGLGRRSGSAGEMSVSVLTRSGRRAATLVLMAPPSELPMRCTGPRERLSSSEMTASTLAPRE